MGQVDKLNTVYVNQTIENVIFNGDNLSINQELNAFIHKHLKARIGVRKYLYDIENIIFTALTKDELAVVGKCFEDISCVQDMYETYIFDILRENWKKNKGIAVRYFYFDNGVLREIQKKECLEKPNSKVIYFNEKTNKQTFENFISSDENLNALEVCQSIACYLKKELVNAGSVVFLYGETSTGKTHLVNAIKNFYSSCGGGVILMTGDDFLRNYVSSVQQQLVFDFQDKIMNNEVIIIDDVDDLIGKNGTLTELSKIITNAIEKKKYVILTSKTLPRQLMEKNLLFQKILSNSISLCLKKQQNALKTAIAMNYICDKNLKVPIAIVRDLVVNLDCNIRELKSYINKLSIVQSIRKFDLNTSLAFEILADDIRQNCSKKQVSNDEIVEIVANYYSLSVSDLKSNIKQKQICKARNIAMYLMKDVNSANFQEIGRILNRNHSTIISSIRNVEKWFEVDKHLPAEIANIREGLKKNNKPLF